MGRKVIFFAFVFVTVFVAACGGNTGTNTVTQFASDANSATLSWQAPNQNEDGSILMDLSGFKIYEGPDRDTTTMRVISTVDDPGILTVVVDNLVAGNHYFAVTAVNGSGVESDFSNVVGLAAD